MNEPTPVTIIGGFLGAGKTTLLNRLLSANHGLRLAVLVNDFGEINIDAALIAANDAANDDDGVISLANGCICCTLGEDLVAQMLQLMQRPSPPDHIVVETSGISQPSSVVALLSRPELRPFVQVNGVICVVDAEQVVDQSSHHVALIDRQLASADILVLNKIDLVTVDQLEMVEFWLRRRKLDARIVRARHGQADVSLMLGRSMNAIRLSATHATDDSAHTHLQDDDHTHADAFATWSYRSDSPLSFEALYDALKALPPTIYRAKGLLYLADFPHLRCIAHVVGTRVRLDLGEPWAQDERKRTELVFIGEAHSGNPVDTSNELRRRIDACRADCEPLATPSLEATFEWMRSRLVFLARAQEQR